jgi:hypothetical protein
MDGKALLLSEPSHLSNALQIPFGDAVELLDAAKKLDDSDPITGSAEPDINAVVEEPVASVLSAEAVAALLTNNGDANSEVTAAAVSRLAPLVRKKKVRDATKIMQLLLYARGVVIRLGKHTFTTNEDHTWDPVYFLQFNNQWGDILHDEDNLLIENTLFVTVFQCPEHLPEFTNMHGQLSEETCISIATIELADMIAEGSLTVDGEEVRSVEDVEERITGNTSRVLQCKQRVDELFGLLKTVVPKKKKRAATSVLTAKEIKKQKREVTKPKKMKRAKNE